MGIHAQSTSERHALRERCQGKARTFGTLQRNRERFPDDFMFQWTAEELDRLKSRL
jgi:hypothetical protein